MLISFDKRADHGKMEYVDGNGNPMPTFAAVANVPWIIGFSAGTISYLRYGLVEVLETATSTIGPDLSFAQVGFLQNYKTMKEVILNTDLASGSEEMLAFRANIVEYVGQCVLRQAAPVNNRVLDIFTKPPTGHTLDALVPANVGLTDANKIAPPGGGAEVSCVDFFTDNIEDKAQNMAQELYNNLKDKIKPLNLDTMGDALSDTFGAKASSAIIAGSNDLVSYMMNAAIIEPMEAAKGFDQLGLVSPTEGINKSAAAMAKRTLQTGTTGNLMWMSEILPYALTFISGIVYAVGIFPLLFYLFTGNPAVIFTYVKSIISIELVHFGMAITHNATSFYSANKAQDILISIFANENAGNATTLLPQLEYLATMTGVAGTIGVIVALGVPMLVMRGEVGGMLGALNALAGRYNNDARTVRDQQAQAWEGKRMREENEASDYLKSLGISAPKGVGDMEYANRIRQGMDNMGRAYASMVATSQPHDKGYMQGATTGAVNQVGNTVGMGTSGVNVSQAMMAGQLMGASSGGNMMGLANSGTSLQQAADSGRLQGRSQGINMQEQSRFADNKDYYEGVSRQSRSGLEKTRGMGMGDRPSQSDWNDLARQSSGQFQEGFAGARGYNKIAMDGNNLKSDYAKGVQASANTKANEHIEEYKARKEQGIINENSELSELGLKSMSRTMGFKAAEYAGVGKATFTDGKGGLISDSEAFNYQAEASSGKTSEKNLSNVAYVENAMSGGGLRSEYEKGFTTTEASKIAGTIGLGSQSSEVQQKYIQASHDQGILKANQTIGDTEGQMKKYTDEAKSAGKELSQTIQDINKTLAESKVGASIAGIKQVGDAQYVENSERRAAGMQSALKSEIDFADNTFGGYEQYKSDMAKMSTAQTGGKALGLAGKLNEKTVTDMADGMRKNGISESALAGLYNEDGSIKTGADAAAWVASKQAGNLEGMHGLTVEGKKYSLSVDDNNVRFSAIESQETITSGNKTDFYNDQVNLHNTAAPTNAALGLKDGNLKEAANLMKSRDAADHWSNPKNWGTMGTAWIADTFFGGDQEAAVAAASGAGGMFASGVLLASLEKATVDKSGHMQLDKEDLRAFDSKADGYYDKGSGVKVADADGYALDSEGNRAVDTNRKGKGVVRRGLGSVADEITSLALQDEPPIKTSSQPINGSTQQQNPPEHKGSKDISTHTKTSSVDFSSGNFTQIPTRAQVGSFSGIGSPPMPSALDLKTYQQVPLSDVPGSIGHTGKDATLHGKGGGGRLLGKALGVAGVALVGSELHAATKEHLAQGDYTQAATEASFVVAEAFDPTFFGVQTARQQGTIAAEQIKGGQYKEAAATVAQTPKVFAENAYKTGEALRQEYDNYSSIAENLHREIHGTPKNEFIGSGLNLQQALNQTPLQEAVAKVDGNALMEEQEQMQKEQRSLNVENNVMETKTRSDQALGAIEDMAEKLEETQAQLKYFVLM